MDRVKSKSMCLNEETVICALTVARINRNPKFVTSFASCYDCVTFRKCTDNIQHFSVEPNHSDRISKLSYGKGSLLRFFVSTVYQQSFVEMGMLRIVDIRFLQLGCSNRRKQHRVAKFLKIIDAAFYYEIR
ncbi:unnamed protein product [Arabis nemorensis]|uniref:Uncharacterized protein n=1 Tax=Arabis nemorensis TaxID=586526 RepID=A0A565AWC1_9BRAS|nr:unnamed protein product [Arabis nemorensis]